MLPGRNIDAGVGPNPQPGHGQFAMRTERKRNLPNESVNKLKTVGETSGCLGCPLRALDPRNTFVGPQVRPGIRLSIGDKPSEDDSKCGQPFSGGSGRWLEFLGTKAGFRKNDLNIINTICCRPPGDAYPLDHEAKGYISKDDGRRAVNHCMAAHVWPFVESRKWERVDLFGARATEFVAERKEPISTLRGSPISIPRLDSRTISVPTLHPDDIGANQVLLPVIINDLRKSLQLSPEYYNLHPSLEDVQNFRSKIVCFDIEKPKYWTMGKHAPIEMCGISDRPYHVMVVPCSGAYLSELKRIFREADVVIGQNIVGYDLPELEAIGVKISPDCQIDDTMLMHHLRFPDLEHSLAFIGSCFGQKEAWKDNKKDFELYCARDVDITIQAWKQLKPMIEHEGLMDLYRNVQIPLGRICKLMTDTGFKIDPTRIDDVREKLKLEQSAIERLLPESLRTRTIIVGKRSPAPSGTLGKSGKPVKYIVSEVEDIEVPWASSVKVGDYLYRERGYDAVYDLKSGRISTGKVALDKLFARTKDPAIRAVKILRKTASMLNLFAKEDMRKSGVVHGSFLVHGTASGRLSSSNPNMQNVTEVARHLYVPRHPGWSIIDVDYSGIENRLTAFIADDQERLNRFLTIPDYSEHKHAVSVFFGIPYCLAPKTRVLKTDLTWVSVDSLKIGDLLIGFDEQLSGYTRGKGPVYKESAVTALGTAKIPCYKITTDRGVVIASSEHKWVAKAQRYSGTHKFYNWTKTSELKPFDELLHLADPWEEDTTKVGGYIAGLLDGEGWVTKTGMVGFAQKPGKVLDSFIKIVQEAGFTVNSDNSDIAHLRFQGEPLAGLKALGMYRPIRLLEKAENIWKGAKVWGVGSNRVVVREVEYIGDHNVITLETSTHTLLAEGYLSHNSDVEKDNSKDAAYGKAKRIVHGSNYGMGAKKISLMYDMDFTETKELLAKWKGALKKTVEWQERLAAEAKREGFLTTPFGRKRWFYTSSSYTESLSFLPQSTAADIIFRAMIALLYERINWPLDSVRKVVSYVEPLPKPANLLIQVHDALIIECPNEMVPQVVGILKRVLEQPWRELGGFSLPIGIAVGPSWGETEKYTGPIE